MKEQVKEMFAQVSMPEETQQKIRGAMTAQRHPRKHHPGLVRAVTAAAVLALVLLVSPAARAAVEDWVLRYVFPESGLSIYKQTDENGEVCNVMVVDTESPPFAYVREGRLYYSHNGEETDITDQITETQPYYHTYVDDYGLTHYRAVGYSGSVENYGIYEFVKGEDGWEGGSGRNFLDAKTETRYPWVDIVWAEWNIPWPMPE